MTGWIQDRCRYRTGVDTGQGQIQDRGRYRTGADTGQGQIQQCNTKIDLSNKMPDLHNNIPDLHNNIPDLHNNIPDLYNNLPKLYNSILGLSRNCSSQNAVCYTLVSFRQPSKNQSSLRQLRGSILKALLDYIVLVSLMHVLAPI